MEELRAPIVDATVLALIHRRQVSPADFVLPAEPGLPCLLTDAARKRVTGGSSPWSSGHSCAPARLRRQARARGAREIVPNMASLFARAQERLQALLRDHDLQKAWALIFALGKNALAKHWDCMFLHRERPIEPPRAGL